MFFFKKKKLLEIDKKIDSVHEQFMMINQRQEDMLSFLARIEHRLNTMEERIASSQSTVSQSIKQTETSIVKEISSLEECIKILDDEMKTLSEKTVVEMFSKLQTGIDEIYLVRKDISMAQKDSIAVLSDTIRQSYEQMKLIIGDDKEMCRERLDAVVRDLDDKLDMIDSSLRLLLLNSVMDQMKE